MSRHLKRNELAKALGIGNANITMAVKNKVLVSDDDGKIDIERPVNKIWIENQKARGRVFDLNQIYNTPAERRKATPKVKLNIGEPDTEQVSITKTNGELADLVLKQKKATLKRTQKAIQLDELKIKKQQGALIPFDEAEFLLVYIVEKIRSTAIQEVDSMANVYKERFNISQQEYIEVKKDLNDSVNDIIKDTVKELKSGLVGIQEKYQEVRDRGESK